MKRNTSFLIVAMMVASVGCTTNNYYSSQTPAAQTPTATASADAGSSVVSDTAPAIAPDTAATVTIVLDSGTAKDAEIVVDTSKTDIVSDSGSTPDVLPVTVDAQANDALPADTTSVVSADAQVIDTQSTDTAPSCKIGTTVDIGNGIEPSIAGSNSGFGVIWKDNTHMPNDIDKVMIASLDIGGNKLASAKDITSAADLTGVLLSIVPSGNSYTVDSQVYLYSNFVRFGTDGQIIVSAYNQSVMNLIAGTQNMYGFFNNGSMAPELENFSFTSTGLEQEKSYEWGPSQRSSFKTTVGALTGGTWAFGMLQDKIEIVVVKDGSVYTVSADFPSGIGSIDIGHFIATDDGYVLLWITNDPQGNTKYYLSFVPASGESDGIIKKTVDITSFFPRIYLNSHLAWNGKNIGLMTASVATGGVNLYLLDKNGVQVGDTVNVIPDGTDKWYEARGDLAASGSAFGVVMSGVSKKVQFTPVNCN